MAVLPLLESALRNKKENLPLWKPFRIRWDKNPAAYMLREIPCSYEIRSSDPICFTSPYRYQWCRWHIRSHIPCLCRERSLQYFPREGRCLQHRYNRQHRGWFRPMQHGVRVSVVIYHTLRRGQCPAAFTGNICGLLGRDIGIRLLILLGTVRVGSGGICLGSVS